MASSLPQERLPFDRPPLGYPVRLGELYDVREDRFLGVQLYSEDTMNSKTTSTPSPSIDFKVSASNSFQQKSDQLDIKAELSLSILSGMVTVEGSGKYLSSSEANTRQQSWAMTLKLRKKEERLRWAEIDSELVLPLVDAEYLQKDRATHFVSAIKYGGNIIVNATARETDTKDEQTVEGELKVDMEKLKGYVSGGAEAKLEVKNISTKLNKDYEFTVYGDIPPNDMPFTPAEVAGFMSTSNTKIGDGIPIIAVLTPIPESIRDVSELIHTVEQAIIAQLLDKFADLDDIRARFIALRSRGSNYRKFIPLLSAAADKAVTTFNAAHAEYLLKLKNCVISLKSGVDEDATAKALTQEVQALLLRHTKKNNPELPEYSDGLLSLEEAFDDFERLLKHVTDAGGRFVLPKEALLAINSGSVFPFIPLPALRPGHIRDYMTTSTSITSRLEPFPKPTRFQVLYVEDPGRLEGFPFPDVSDRALKIYVGEVKEGVVAWRHGIDAPKAVLDVGEPQPDFSVDLRSSYIGRGQHYPDFKVGNIDGAGSWSVMLDVSYTDENSGSAPFKLLGLNGSRREEILTFPFPNVGVEFPSFNNFTPRFISSLSYQVLTPNSPTKVTFVQDRSVPKWYLYVNERKVAEQEILEKVLEAYSSNASWNSLYIDGHRRPSPKVEIGSVNFFGRAITPLEIRSAISL